MSESKDNALPPLVALCEGCGRIQIMKEHQLNALLTMNKVTCAFCNTTGRVDPETKVDIHYERLVKKREDGAV